MPATPEPEPSLVFDATVLSNFALIDHVPLLGLRYRERACTTLMVVEEMQRGLETGYLHLHAIEAALAYPWASGWLSVVPLEPVHEQPLYVDLSSSLGAGEASCLAVAVSRRLILATDDLAARREASRRGVRLTGTVGILISMVRAGDLQLAQANGLLSQMIAFRFRAPVDHLDELV